MSASKWQSPPGAGANQMYLWALNLIRALQRGDHKDYKAIGVTLSAGTTTTVAEASVASTSRILLTPTSLGASDRQPYVSAKTGGVGFTLTHLPASGLETYDCIVISD